MKKINTIIFGATGKIGESTLSIINKNRKSINLEGITCNNNLNKLLKIAKSFNVKKIGFNEKNINTRRRYDLNKYEIYNDLSNFHHLISKKTDVIIFAISGLSCIDLLLKILKNVKKIGMANKEIIITLGKKFNTLSKKYNTDIVPLDSEHNSIYHLLNQNLCKFKSITITATGGPFLKYTQRQFKNITVNQAIKHPVWSMGKKISIDSATMMNKALEKIEAKYLFNLNDCEIEAIIHPQAIVHAIINYKNGVSNAILNKPDMRIPISSVFFDFNNHIPVIDKIDFKKKLELEFIPIDEKKFPAMRIGAEVMKMGGMAPHIFNYLNELLVNLFLRKQISFIDIVYLNEINLERFFNKNSNNTNPKLIDIKNVNNWIDKNLYIGN